MIELIKNMVDGWCIDVWKFKYSVMRAQRFYILCSNVAKYLTQCLAYSRHVINMLQWMNAVCAFFSTVYMCEVKHIQPHLCLSMLVPLFLWIALHHDHIFTITSVPWLLIIFLFLNEKFFTLFSNCIFSVCHWNK